MTAAFRLAMVFGIAALVSSAEAADALKLRFVAAAYADSKDSGLREPQAVACGPAGIALADGDGRIVVYEAGDKTLKARSEIALREVGNPLRLDFLPGGDLLVLDGRSRRVARVSPTGEFKSYVGLPTDGAGPDVVARSLAVDPSGAIYVLDIASGRIMVMDAAGAVSRRIAVPGSRGLSDVAPLRDGSVLVVDAAGKRVLRAGPGDAEAVPWGEDLGDRVEFPVSIAVDESGRVVLLDRHAGAVVSLRSDGSFGGRLLEFGWGDGQVRYPSDLCLDGVGRLFVVDRANRRVQMFQVAN